MVFNSSHYLLFLPVVCIVYFLLPRKARNLWLLAASYFFYMCWNARFALLILTSTVVTYGCGLLLQKDKDNRKRCRFWLAASLLLNLGILFYYKYADFAIITANWVARHLGIGLQLEEFNPILPVGISFYTFQALGYTMDVYRQKTKAEKNFFTYALFVSFFPQLVAGPIERSGNLLGQLKEHKKFDPRAARDGLVVVLWGFFMKVLLADNISHLIDPVFSDWTAYYAMDVVLAVILFAVQIYCDFAGYTYIAIGSARILGFRLMDNFDSPYLARSVADFWRRWHISLTSWFTDYLYIPLGGSRKGKLRRYVNTMIVFLVSGLWHGAEWSFVVWGGLNGMYIVLGHLTKDLRERIRTRLRVDAGSFGYRFLQCLTTFAMVDFAWLFFRAEGVRHALQLLRYTVTTWEWHRIFSEKLFLYNADPQMMMVLLCGMATLLAVDILQRRGTRLEDFMARQDRFFRWFVYAAAVVLILVFGGYGNGYYQTQFIYFQF